MSNFEFSIIISPFEQPIITTFAGFENDPFKKKDIYLINDVYENNVLVDYPSVLDRVLQYNNTQNFKITNTKICTRKINDIYVCDHMPLIFDCTF